MRSILAIVLVLAGIGIVSCRLDGVSAGSDAPGEVAWVRTADGWERSGNWLPAASAAPRLHPLMVASGQALGSALALAAFATKARRP
jgi:hypothetical protein